MRCHPGVLALLALGACTASRGRQPAPTEDPRLNAEDSSASPETPAGSSIDAGRSHTAAACFVDLAGPGPLPNYDRTNPTIAASCAGTHHQTIEGVEKVVFLGDSITVGTPPTQTKDLYRVRLENELRQKFGANLEVTSCAEWGARIEDLLEAGGQIASCFPSGVETKRTLVVMTNGGNDVHQWARDKLGAADALARAEQAIVGLEASVEWLRSPAHFPNGSFVVYASAYEYTDASGDLSSCPTSVLAGVSGDWSEGRPAVVRLSEGFLEVAVRTRTDMVFLLEHFCGHGFRRQDPQLQCFRSTDAALWFDLTCIHPNPRGHAEIASLFAQVIDGR